MSPAAGVLVSPEVAAGRSSPPSSATACRTRRTSRRPRRWRPSSGRTAPSPPPYPFSTACRTSVASGGNDATTVSATMFFAHKVDIPIFVTGGIGGLHRYGEKTMDISSDLTELGKTPVAVISAGVKSILDITRTLEYLETQGVTVAVYRTNEFPAFFTETSDCKAPCRIDSPEECAKIIHANKNMHLESGILIAVPVPKQHAASGKAIESAIQQSLKEAADKKITGNAIIPFILHRVKVLTGGASLEANIALVKNNALTGAKIAVALSNLQKRAANNWALSSAL